MISNSGHDECGKYSGGQAGDQGGEWQRQKWYNRPWNVVLRYPDISVGSLIAQLAGEAADNDRIGYDQGQRTTFWRQLKAVGYFPSKITTACESDCSAGVAAIVKAVGYILGLSRLQSVSADMYTGNEKSALTGAGFSALTDSKYLTSDEYLLPGDILLYEGHHTAINLDRGSKVMASYNLDTHINIIKNRFPVLRAQGYVHGDSHSYPPNCPATDRITSCDREILAYPLWQMGYKDQPQHGLSVMNMEPWLLSHGWTKITNQNALQRGDVVLMRNVSTTPNAAWHTFMVLGFRNTGDIDKYDFGDTRRWMKDNQPYYHVPLNEWTGTRWFYCAFRYGSSKEYVFTPSAVKRGSTGSSQYMANVICKARDCKGIKGDNGQLKDIELNGTWSIGDMAAMAQIKLGRLRAGYNDMGSGAGAGEVSVTDFTILLGSTLPFHCVELPAKQTSGVCVLLWQEHLRANEFKGSDGNLIKLDRQWGPNCEYATKAWQKSVGRPQTGKVEYEDWRIALKNI